MSNAPAFAIAGNQTDSIDVRLSYKIVELFSEGLYASPNKAIEELVANSFDAGALQVQVLYSSNLHAQDATIAIIDDGEGMNDAGLKQHWLIGISNKRRLGTLPKGRQQIGKFGIGKLATYVLANRLTHLSKRDGKYYSTSMDYTDLDKRVDREIEPKTPIKLPLRQLTEQEAKAAVSTWSDTAAFKASKMILFGKGATDSWTVAIMSSLKPKVHDIKPGILEWVLCTALPLRDDFGIWLNGVKLKSSKQGKGLLKKWVLGKDLTTLPKPSPKDVSISTDKNVEKDSDLHFGLDVGNLGRITGYAEIYKDLLTGKSDELGRSYGFFVYVRDRLVNVLDGHFGISPDELRHGTFGRFRLVVHMDSLDDELRSNRETISEGTLLGTAQDVLRAIFNAVRPILEKHDDDEEPGAQLARKLAASPASLSRRPIVDLARAVVEGKSKSRFLIVPRLKSQDDKHSFLEELEKRSLDAANFVAGLTIDYNGSQDDGIAQFDTGTGILRINAWHPFVATFHDEFANKGTGQPLELFAMAEVLSESHLHGIGIKPEHINDFLSTRDQLLRNLANESGRQSAFAIASNLLNARSNPDALEDKMCAAFTSLGFEVTPIGGKGKPDGVARANLAADDSGHPQRYSVSLEAKSKEKGEAKVSAKTIGVSGIVRHRDKFDCDHAIIVGQAFATSQGDDAAIAKEIADDRAKTKAVNAPKTITLITIDDLAKLVRLRPTKQVGLRALRQLFEQCKLDQDSAAWVEAIRKSKVAKPPYKQIVATIESLQKKWKKAPVKYDTLRNELSHLSPPIVYETNDSLIDLCKAMAQMAPGSMFATADAVELDQSADNVLAAIDGATKDYPIDEQ
jgi:hypothetical protein